MINLEEVRAACEYMGDDVNLATMQGESIGRARVAYVKSHKEHQKLVFAEDFEKIESTWEDYCAAQYGYIMSLYS